jgi:hypothetical protein
MNNPVWNVVWSTHGTWPPQDSRGDWARLSEFYSPLTAAGSVAVSRPLPLRYSRQASEAVVLSQKEFTDLCKWLLELTNDDGDRVAGGHHVLAATFLPTQAYVLFQCERAALAQVVGRLKSRLAALLLIDEQRISKKRKIWSSGFWQAEILEDNAIAQAKAFVEGLQGTNCGEAN